MNIYVDIDGVLLDTLSPVEDCIEFLEFLLAHFPNSTYWLTTHCNYGENHTNYTLRGVYPDDLVDRVVDTFQETNFGRCKTNGIDFSQPFLWFDDDLFYDEQQALVTHNALSSHIKMDERDPQMMRKALAILKAKATSN
jgi:hypothetical protein